MWAREPNPYRPYCEIVGISGEVEALEVVFVDPVDVARVFSRGFADGFIWLFFVGISTVCGMWTNCVIARNIPQFPASSRKSVGKMWAKLIDCG